MASQCLAISTSKVARSDINENLEDHLSKIDERVVELLQQSGALTSKVGLLKISDSHKIQLIDESKVVQCNPYRKTPSDRDFVNSKVEKLLSEDKVEEADPRFLSPVVLASKSDGDKQLCIDFRKVNQNTKKQSFPIPNTQDLYNNLKDAKIFTKNDLESAFHQVRMAEEDKEKTGFITQDGTYQRKCYLLG